MMTDPHSIFELDHNYDSPSDRSTDTNLDSPAIPISSMHDGGRTSSNGSVAATGTANVSGSIPKPGLGSIATNHPSTSASASAYTTNSHLHAEHADTANPSQDTRPVFLPEDL